MTMAQARRDSLKAGGLAFAGFAALPSRLFDSGRIEVIGMRSDASRFRVQFDPVGLHLEPGTTVRGIARQNEKRFTGLFGEKSSSMTSIALTRRRHRRVGRALRRRDGAGGGWRAHTSSANSRVYEGMEQLVGAGVLLLLPEGRRNRWVEAAGLLDVIGRLEAGQMPPTTR